ncbi:MAG TPA: DMT family transporter [Mariprofundaceae bacterium]|nr:DMT family transporter [Mariprofundaceae bacterium]
MANANTYLLVTTAALFWGANFVLGGFVLQDMTPLWAAAMRFVLGAALMLAIAGFAREPLFAPLRRHGATYLMLGVVGIVAFNLFFFYALRDTSANNAALIMATNPLLTTLLAALLLNERPGLRHLVALPVALAGVAVVVTEGHLANLLALHFSVGDLLMLAANLFWALYNVFCRRYMPPGSPLVNTTWIMAAGGAVLLTIALGSGEHLAWPHAKAEISMAVMAVGGTVLAYLFWSMGIVRLGAARTAIFLNLVPVFAMLLGAVVAAPPTASQLAGGLLVLIGVSISILPSRRLAPA